MKLVLPGGSGHLGRLLTRTFEQQGHEVVILSRRGAGHGRVVPWDGRTLGAWAHDVDGADAVVNLAGRSVNCRYTKDNLTEMLTTRVDAARVVGEAIQQAARPPRVWLQMSTATIYAHRFDAANDECTGVIGGDEPDAPAYWRFSVEIAKAWERVLADAETQRTRKVALRTAMVMAPGRGGTFDLLSRLTRLGLGGPIAGGRQFLSWVHADDFARAVLFLLERDDLSGPVNLAAPNPLPHCAFMAALRAAWGVPFGVPAAREMLEVATVALRTDSELILKSRRVVPRRLLDAGFTFAFPEWSSAARDLVARARTGGTHP